MSNDEKIEYEGERYRNLVHLVDVELDALVDKINEEAEHEADIESVQQLFNTYRDEVSQ